MKRRKPDRSLARGGGKTKPLSRCAALGRWPARAILALLALLMVAALVRPPAPVPNRTGTSADKADVLLYERIVERVRAGGDYYVVAAEAQRAGSYPLRPFVTVRLPMLAWFQAALPGDNAVRAIFMILFGVTLGAWFARLRWSGWDMRHALLGALAVGAGAATLALPELLVWHEAWAALLIALSLAMRGEKRFAQSAVLGLAAILIRELAILYPLVMLFRAVLERRRAEALAWLAAIALFAAFIAWHAAQVALVVRPDDLASPGWTSAGGWRFVVTMIWQTGPLRLAPFWIAAVLVPLSLLGWAGWRHPSGVRGALLLAGYAAAFALLGRPNNFYWAFLIAPLVPLGLLLAPRALVDLSRAAFAAGRR